MAKKSLELFINAFSVYNQDRYKDDATNLPKFQNLTEADLTVSNIAIAEETGVVSATVVSTTRNFKSADTADQTFIRADINNAKILPFTAKTLDGVTDQASFLAAIAKIEETGIYQVAVPELNGETAILVIHATIPEDTAPEDEESVTQKAVTDAIDAALLYTFDEARTVTTVGSTYVVADNFLKGALYHAPAAAATLVIPATDYGHLDDETYDPTM